MEDEEKAKEQAKKAVEWIASEEGSRILKEALEKVRIECDKLKKAREVSWEDMHRPCTI